MYYYQVIGILSTLIKSMDNTERKPEIKRCWNWSRATNGAPESLESLFKPDPNAVPRCSILKNHVTGDNVFNEVPAATEVESSFDSISSFFKKAMIANRKKSRRRVKFDLDKSMPIPERTGSRKRARRIKQTQVQGLRGFYPHQNAAPIREVQPLRNFYPYPDPAPIEVFYPPYGEKKIGQALVPKEKKRIIPMEKKRTSLKKTKWGAMWFISLDDETTNRIRPAPPVG